MSAPTSSSVEISRWFSPKRRSTTSRCLSLASSSHCLISCCRSSRCKTFSGSGVRSSAMASSNERSGSSSSGASTEATRSLRPSMPLTSPPRRVGGETEAALGVELFHRANQTEIAFLDEIEQRKAAVHVTAGYFDHEAQVAFDHALARLAVAFLRLARKKDLLLGGQQRRKTDLLKIDASGVRVRVVHVARPASAGFG